jgi:hypothetical protein
MDAMMGDFCALYNAGLERRASRRAGAWGRGPTTMRVPEGDDAADLPSDGRVRCDPSRPTATTQNVPDSVPIGPVGPLSAPALAVVAVPARAAPLMTEEQVPTAGT